MFRPLVGSGRGDEDESGRRFTSLKLRFQDFQRWIKKGTPAMILTLLVSSVLFWLFFDFFAVPIHPH
jgi:hypothetical protein